MVTKSLFQPCWWGKNPHVQTLVPTLVRSLQAISYIKERLLTWDGDFLDLAWTAQPTRSAPVPIVIFFHGLEGSIQSPYVKGIFSEIRRQGWIGVMMHFRGCSGEPNRLQRGYHSGETSDAAYLIEQIHGRYPSAPLFAVGYSLGGNMLLKYLGEQKTITPIKAAVAVSVPFKLESCAAKLEKGFSQLYQRHLLDQLIANTKRKMSKVDYSDILTLPTAEIDHLKTFREFDEHFTAPIHGFRGADDYYERCSSRQYLGRIARPTLILQARDDPFMSEDALPVAAEMSEQITFELSNRGGHVGFISGGYPWDPQFWLEKRIPRFIQGQL